MSDRHTYELPGLDTTFIADRLRRDHHELIGELSVKCGLPGAQTVNGVLDTSDFNFSSLRARQDRAKFFAQRAQTRDLDWYSLLLDFTQRVFESERTGDPAVKLRDLPRPVRDDDIHVESLTFPRRHPTIIFGDGGAAKSYTALRLAGRLVQQGFNVALFDWELCGEDHRDRYERLFGADMPENLYYVRCERPLTAESDRLRRVVRECSIGYAIYDSIAFACDGRPEDAEVAGRYFRAVREIGCGSLHVAHVNKSDENDKKPFGSSFWHNGARSTWNVQAVEQTGDGTLRLGFFNRKSNLGPLRQPVGYELTFSDSTTEFRRVDVADSPDLAQKLSVRQRMNAVLKRGSMTIEEITQTIDATPDAIRMAAKRDPKRFVLLDGGRIGLRA